MFGHQLQSGPSRAECVLSQMTGTSLTRPLPLWPPGWPAMDFATLVPHPHGVLSFPEPGLMCVTNRIWWKWGCASGKPLQFLPWPLRPLTLSKAGHHTVSTLTTIWRKFLIKEGLRSPTFSQHKPVCSMREPFWKQNHEGTILEAESPNDLSSNPQFTASFMRDSTSEPPSLLTFPSPQNCERQ